MRIASVVGARPQFVKLGVMDRAIHSAKRSCEIAFEHLIAHTGQHYDNKLSQCFFDELGLPRADVNLGIGSGSHGEQTGRMLAELDRWLVESRPDVVLTYGDTNSTLAAALAAVKLHIPVAHVESGLRSYRKTMPEEINRVLSDHSSTFLFCPTTVAVRNLQSEGFADPILGGQLVPEDVKFSHFPPTIDVPWIANVGDVMYDSVLRHVERAQARGVTESVLQSLPSHYAVLTVHRADNTDNPQRLQAILESAARIARAGTAIVFPIHPRTRQAIERAALAPLLADFITVSPISYYDMLLVVREADLVLTDSGGVQREAFMLGRPCVTLREETEWVELLETGLSVLGGTDPQEILDAVERVTQNVVSEPISPYGDGHAANRIMALIGSWWRDLRA